MSKWRETEEDFAYEAWYNDTHYLTFSSVATTEQDFANERKLDTIVIGYYSDLQTFSRKTDAEKDAWLVYYLLTGEPLDEQ